MRCIYMKTIVGRDGRGNEVGELDWCKEYDHLCVLMTGDKCEEYEEQLGG